MKVDLIDSMGSDLTVVNSARVSFDRESEWQRFDCHECQNSVRTACSESCACVGQGATTALSLSSGDERLINYLAKHNHISPFTHPQITLRETVPIFVARQRFKHVVGFTYNEVSRRYVDDEPEFYIPEVWRSRPEGSVKQGSGQQDLSDTMMYGLRCSDAYLIFLDHAETLYKGMIQEGVAPEQARMVLPQSMYTSYYVTGSLAAFARFYKQRIDAHAQKEIQGLAEKVGEIIAPMFPVSWKALTEV